MFNSVLMENLMHSLTCLLLGCLSLNLVISDVKPTFNVRTPVLEECNYLRIK